MRRITALTIVVLVLLPHAARAHANLLESDPAPNSVVAQAPATARLRFSEPVEPSSSRVVLVDANGAAIAGAPSRVAADDAHVMLLDLPALAEGRYALQWRALSSLDGHITEGTVPFAIGDPSAADAPLLLPPPPADPLALPSPAESVLRWLMYLSLSSVIGSLIFGASVWRRAAGTEVERVFRRSTRRLEQAAALLAVVAACGILLVSARDAGTDSIVFATQSRVGGLLALRAGLALLLLAAVFVQSERYRRAAGMALGTAVLLSISLLSHNAVPHGEAGIAREATTALAIGFDWAHLLATAAWLGGLLPLLLALLALRGAPPADRGRQATKLVARFTALATAAVIVLAATGTYTAFRHVGEPRELWSTTYGRALSLKLVLFGALLLLGGYNRWRVHPRLASVTGTGAAGSDVAALLARLRRSIGLELAAGVVLLLAVGVLTAVVPARSAGGTSSRSQSTRVGGVRLALQVAPAGIAGDIFALDVQGLPATVTPEVLLRTSMPEHGMAEQELDLQEVEPGRWGARASLLTMAGAWNVEAIVRARGMDDIRHTFVVDTAETAADNGPGAPPMWALIVVGALLLAALGQLPVTRRTRTGLAAASALLLGGALLAPLGARLAPVASTESTSAAVPADAAAGRAVYEQNCVSCHGATGRGDGSAGWALNPRPADFTLPHFETHSDAELVSTITNGVPGTGMPAFRSQLSDQQIRDVIAYLRQFGGEQ